MGLLISKQKKDNNKEKDDLESKIVDQKSIELAVILRSDKSKMGTLYRIYDPLSEEYINSRCSYGNTFPCGTWCSSFSYSLGAYIQDTSGFSFTDFLNENELTYDKIIASMINSSFDTFYLKCSQGAFDLVIPPNQVKISIDSSKVVDDEK